MIKDSEITQTLQANQPLLVQQHAALIENLQKKIANTLSDDLDYVPVRGGFSFQSRPQDEVEVNTYVQQYLNSERKVLLLLGDSGAGKSLYCQQLVKDLWTQYQVNPAKQPLPLLISLPQLKNPTKLAIEETLQGYGLSVAEIKLLKQHQSFVFILDGYDEIRQTKNLYMTNGLSEWHAKTIITCRSQYLFTIEHYEPYFMPYKQEQVQGWLFAQLIIKPFNQAQIEKYLQQYVQHHATDWNDWRLYLKHIETIPGLKQLIQTPFLLKIAVEAMPEIVTLYAQQPEQRLQLTQAKLYDVFVEQWFTRQAEKLKDNGQLKDDATFKAKLWTYAKALAKAMHQQNVTHIAYEETSDLFEENTEDNVWANFFSDDKEIQLLRSASLVQKIGVNQYAFFHSSLIEYFITRELYEETKVFADTHNNSTSEKTSVVTVPTQPTQKSQIETVSNTNSTQSITNPGFSATNLPTNYRYFNQRLLTDEAGMLQFLADRVTESEAFKQDMFKMIEGSKHDPNMKVGAANAISALNKAGLSFATLNLSGVRIPHADLSYSNCDHTNFEQADLSHVNFTQAWLQEVNFKQTILNDIEFGQRPWLDHGSPVRALAYHPNGKLMATASGVIVNLWDIEQQTKIKEFTGHTDFISSLTFSSDGKFIASGSWDETIRIWHLSSEKFKVFKIPNENEIDNLSSGKKTKAKKNSTLNSIHMEDLLNGFLEPSELFARKMKQKVTSIAFLPASEKVVAGCWDSNIYVFDINNNKVEILQGHSNKITSVDASADGQWVVSGSDDHTVRAWELTTGKELVFDDHNGRVTAAAFSPSGKWVISGSEDKTVRLWELATGEKLKFKLHSKKVLSVAFSPDERWIVSGAKDKTVCITELATQQSMIMKAHTHHVNQVAFSKDGKYAVSGSQDGTVRFWKLNANRIKLSKKHKENDIIVAVSPDGKLVATNTESSNNFNEKIITILDVSTGKLNLSLKHPGKIKALAFSPNGQQLVTGSDDKNIYIFDLISGDIQKLAGHEKQISNVIFSPNGEQILSSSEDNTVRIWDISTNQSRILPASKKSEKYKKAVRAIAFSSDGVFIVTGSEDKKLRIYMTVNNFDDISIFKRKDHKGKLTTLAISPETNLLASGSSDNTVHFTALLTHEYKKLIWHKESISSMAFSSDGQWLAVGSEDRTVSIWNTKTSLLETIIYGTKAKITSLAFNPILKPGYQLLVGDKSGCVKCWQSNPSNSTLNFYLVWSWKPTLLELSNIIVEQSKDLSSVNAKLISQYQNDYISYLAAALYEYGMNKFSIGEFEAAIESFSKSIQLNSNDADIFFNRGICNIGLYDYKAALKDFDEVIKLSDKGPEVFGSLRELADHDLAHWEKELTVDKYAEIYHYRGLAKYNLNRFSDAVIDFEQSIQFIATNHEVIKLCGFTHYYLGNYKEALIYFSLLIEANCEDSLVFSMRSILFALFDEKEAAEIDLQLALETTDPDNEEYKTIIANTIITYAFLNNFDKAKEQLKILETLEKNNILLKYYEGWINMLSKNYTEAIECLSFDIDKKSLTFFEIANTFALRAVSYFCIDKYEAGLIDIQKALNYIPEQQEWKSAYKEMLVNKAEFLDKDDRIKNIKVLEGDKITAQENLKDDDIVEENIPISININQIIHVSDLFKDNKKSKINDLIATLSQKKYLEDDLDYYRESIQIYDQAINLDPKNAMMFYKRGYSKAKLNRYEEAILDYDKMIELNFNEALILRNLEKRKMKLGFYLEAIEDNNKAIELDHNSATAFSERASCESELGHYEKAIEDYTKAIELNPKAAAIYNNLGSIKDKLGRYEEALQDLNKVVELLPGNSIVYFNRGSTKFSLSRCEEAIGDFNKAIELNPDNSNYFRMRGACKTNLSQYEEAIEDYNKAIELDLNDALAFCERGFCKSKLDHYQEAIEDYDKAIELNPKNASYFNDRGTSKDSLGRYEEAIEDYDKAIELNPKNASYFNDRGTSKGSLGRYEEAIEDYDKAIELNPKNANNFNNRGISKDSLGRYEEAIEDYDKAIELYSKNSNYFNNRGTSKNSLGRYEEAIEDHDKAIQLDSKDANYFNNRGISKYNLGRYEEAIEDYDKAIELNPKNASYFNNRGTSKDSLGRYEGAIEDYDKAIELNPKNASYFNNRGTSKDSLGRYEGAIEDYDKAIELDSKDANYFNNRGTSKDSLGRYGEAIEDYDKAIELDSKDASYFNDRGTSKNSLGRYEEAIEDHDKAIHLDSKDANYFNNRGISKYNLGRYEEAIEDYDKAIELNPKNASYFNNRGTSKDSLGRYEGAIEDYDKAIELDSKKPSYFNHRGTAKGNLGQYKEAIEDYDKAILLNPKFTHVYSKRGLVKARLGCYQEALFDSEQAMTLASNKNSNIIWGRFAVIWAYQSETQKARQHLAEIKSDLKEIYFEYYFNGLVELLSHNYQMAVTYFNKVLAETVKSPYYLAASLMLRGKAYLALSKFEQARLDMESALKQIPNHQEWQKWYCEIFDNSDIANSPNSPNKKVTSDLAINNIQNNNIEERADSSDIRLAKIEKLGEYELLPLKSNTVDNVKITKLKQNINETVQTNDSFAVPTKRSEIHTLTTNIAELSNDKKSSIASSDNKLENKTQHAISNTFQFWQKLDERNNEYKFSNISVIEIFDKNIDHFKFETVSLGEEITYLSLNDALQTLPSLNTVPNKIDISIESKGVNSNNELDHKESFATNEVFAKNTQTSNLQQRLQFWREKELAAQAQQESLVRSNTKSIQPFEIKPITFNK